MLLGDRHAAEQVLAQAVALRSGSPSGATRSSTCQMCTWSHGTGRMASATKVVAGVLAAAHGQVGGAALG